MGSQTMDVSDGSSRLNVTTCRLSKNTESTVDLYSLVLIGERTSDCGKVELKLVSEDLLIQPYFYFILFYIFFHFCFIYLER